MLGCRSIVQVPMCSDRGILWSLENRLLVLLHGLGSMCVAPQGTTAAFM